MPTFEVVKDPEVAKIVKFCTGKLKPCAKDSMDFKVVKKSEKGQLDVTTRVGTTNYLGQNYGSANHFETDTCKYYVAIHRKGADKVQIVPAELLLLHPRFEEDEDKEDEQEEVVLEKSFLEKREDLILQFGSGQMRNRANRKANQSLNSSMAEVTTRVMANNFEKLDSPSNANEDETVLSSIPIANRNTKVLHNVYPLESIIPNDVMNALMSQSKEFVSSGRPQIIKWRRGKMYPNTVLNILSNLPTDPEQRSQVCAIVEYMNCLIHFYKLKAHEIRKKNVYPPNWTTVVTKLLDDNFITVSTDPRQRQLKSRSNQKRDLVLSHILILYLRLCNYSIDLMPLYSDAKSSMRSLILHCGLLGLHVKKDKTSVTATMTLPLKAPPATRRRRP